MSKYTFFRLQNMLLTRKKLETIKGAQDTLSLFCYKQKYLKKQEFFFEIRAKNLVHEGLKKLMVHSSIQTA